MSPKISALLKRTSAATAVQPVAAPSQAPGRRSTAAPISRRAQARIAAAREALNAGQISQQEFDRRRRGYEHSGQREAAGQAAFDLTY